MGQKLKRFRTKEGRELVTEVRAAGGTVEILASGHFRVTGPAGFAIVGSKLDAPGSRDTARAKIARYAGITIGRKGCGGGRKAG